MEGKLCNVTVRVRRSHSTQSAHFAGISIARWRCVIQKDILLRFVGTSTDVRDSRLAQEELRDTQAELAHVTRVPVNEAVPQTRAIDLAKGRCAGPARGGSVFRGSSSWAM
jgi:hypothetical protein